MNRGVLYIATGEEFFDEAVKSISSLRRQMPEIGITLITDIEKPIKEDISIINLSDPDYSFRDKVQYMKKSPYDKTIFLDSDTYITGDISELFEILDRFDIAATQSGYRRIQFHPHQDDLVATDEIPVSYPEFNTGVIVFRNSARVREVLTNWKKRYDQHLEIQPDVGTQPSFLEVLFESDLDIATLSPEYNCHAHFLGTVSQRVKIIHTHAENVSDVAHQLNEAPSTGRTYIPCMYDGLLSELMVYEGGHGRDDVPGNLEFHRKAMIFLMLVKYRGGKNAIKELFRHTVDRIK